MALAAAAGMALPPTFAAGRGKAAAANPFATIDAMAEALIAEHATPGLSLAVMRTGNLVYARGYGAANLETNTLVTAETVFRVGSISKQFIRCKFSR
jgi:CubicO group peptidase (beta-lactamase class C family)